MRYFIEILMIESYVFGVGMGSVMVFDVVILGNEY